MYNQTAEQLFNEYRNHTENLLRVITRIKDERPNGRCPATAASFWRAGMLAEIWGTVATTVSQNKVNYLEQWRTGK